MGGAGRGRGTTRCGQGARFQAPPSRSPRGLPANRGTLTHRNQCHSGQQGEARQSVYGDRSLFQSTQGGGGDDDGGIGVWRLPGGVAWMGATLGHPLHTSTGHQCVLPPHPPPLPGTPATRALAAHAHVPTEADRGPGAQEGTTAPQWGWATTRGWHRQRGRGRAWDTPPRASGPQGRSTGAPLTP